MADSNRIYVVPIVPNRGLILDRNGVVMAKNYSGYTLEIAPDKVTDMDALIAELSKLVEITPKDIKRFQKLLTERQTLETMPLLSQLERRRSGAHFRAAVSFSRRGDQGAIVPGISLYRCDLAPYRLCRPHQPEGHRSTGRG